MLPSIICTRHILELYRLQSSIMLQFYAFTMLYKTLRFIFLCIYYFKQHIGAHIDICFAMFNSYVRFVIMLSYISQKQEHTNVTVKHHFWKTTFTCTVSMPLRGVFRATLTPHGGHQAAVSVGCAKRFITSIRSGAYKTSRLISHETYVDTRAADCMTSYKNWFYFGMLHARYRLVKSRFHVLKCSHIRRSRS